MATADVLPGKHDEFVAWQARYAAVISKYPGFVSSDILPNDEADRDSWTIIVNFETRKQLLEWRNSEERKAVLAEISSILVGGDFADSHILEGERDAGGSSATEVIFSKIHHGQEDAYREWVSRIQAAQAKYPGYRGAYVQPPTSGKSGHWMTIIRYDTPSHLNDWMGSPERAELLEETDAFIESEEILRFTSAFPGWVPVDPATGESPANWKTAMLVLLGLFPLVVLTVKFVSPLLGDMNGSLATFLGNCITVAATSFITMPLFVRWFRWWLLPQKRRALTSWLGSLLICALYAIEVALLWFLFV